jgi:type IV pilus secretin PilQ/predicted competence protein
MVKVGRMKKNVKVILCGGLITMIACSGAFAAQRKRASVPQVESSRTGAEPMLLDMRAESQPESRLVLRTSGSPAFSSYSPQPDVYVVDLAQTTKSNAVAVPSNLPSFVASMSVDQAIELGKPLTRVTFRFTQPVSPTTASDGDAVVVTFPGSVSVAAAPVSIAAPEKAAPSEPVTVVERPMVAPPLEIVPEPVTIAEEVRPATPGKRATVLRGVETSGSASELLVVLEADGEVEYSSFRLSNPLRLVLDLKGMKNGVAQPTRVVNDPVVKKIRVSQFKSQPNPVTRVVLDLSEMVEYRVSKGSEGLTIAFNDNTGGDTPVVAAKREPAVEKPKPARSEPVFSDEVPVVATVANASRNSYQREVINAPAPEPAPQTPTGTKAPVTTSTRTTVPQSTVRESQPENVFNDQGTASSPSSTLAGGAAPGRTLTAGEKVYTGEPIDLTLKDADIKDVLRTFAQLTGLNIAIDPNVSGRVTVEFDDVPWDQALEIILKQNGLTYTLQGNVMRVGTIDRLAAEQAQIRRLEEDEQLNVPLQTVIKHLSYAKAGVVSTLLGRMASRRGQIDYDARTNQIIITEIPQFLTTMLNLIETVDIPTPQVVIEARVVETTKNFARSLGINWGFSGALDPALGTGTGLVFPNRVLATGGPFNFEAGNPVLTLSLGNVLGTFDLDVTLTAAENEGLAKIVSAPKITTQDNQPAEIQSGVQIPIQTRVNQTTTVTYVDATLRLSVTPQITSQDTVIMEITVQKTEPLSGTNVAGGQNAPLSTRRATTKLMVRDGGTTVIGGIYTSSDQDRQDRLPFVSDIPIIGNLFKNRVIETRHDELLIFITPRIVRNT